MIIDVDVSKLVATTFASKYPSMLDFLGQPSTSFPPLFARHQMMVSLS